MSLTVLSSPVGMPGTCTAGEVGGVLAHAARSIRSDPDFEATAPVAVTIGGASAVQMDVLLDSIRIEP